MKAYNSRYDDEAVDSFYEDVASAMNEVNAHYTIVMGEYNAKVGEKYLGERSGKLWNR